MKDATTVAVALERVGGIDCVAVENPLHTVRAVSCVSERDSLMKRPRPPRSRDGVVSRVLWFVAITGIALGIFRLAGGGVTIFEPGWFDRARGTVQTGVDEGGQIVHDQIDKHLPFTTTPPPPPSRAEEPK
ncbi:hypothetical protein [Nocardia sp. NPDC052566]|uniref:hypothetical protein n=1 Tax=Nocardia sp. NPDC052566 TaxID=3364330 RepID=UPI0037CC8C45